VLEFVRRWKDAPPSERGFVQSHFLDLCHVLGQPTPQEADPTGAFYTFEKGVEKTSGGHGFADVWRRGYFGWEYKGGHADLVAAYRQLQNYAEALENPPLLVVCDFHRFEVHTRFTNMVARVYAFTLGDLLKADPVAGTALPALEVLRAVFTAPERLRPGETRAGVTKDAAEKFASLAIGLQRAGGDPVRVAHFLMRVLFCLFAEDIGLLPDRLFSKLVEATRHRPTGFEQQLRQLFAAMATGDYFGTEAIAHFDGGLFADDEAFVFSVDDMGVLAGACRLDWSSVEPAIFGTLFERSLDPTKRSQLGAHYTSRDDIMLVVEPVLMAPLRREWAAVQGRAQALIERSNAAKQTAPTRASRQRDQDARTALRQLLLGFVGKLADLRILDPACGSGNFLYVALKQLMDLEKEAIAFAGASGLSSLVPLVGPSQLYGLEVNPYASELAQTTVWIGYLQWLHDNGFGYPSDTILKQLHNIQQRDAILALDEQGRPVEPEWPQADIIIGNPPFLGDKKMRADLGDAYVERLRALYAGRVPGGADLVTYWFERARALVQTGVAKRAGLLATNSIRDGTNRRVLDRVKSSGDIFMAWSDRPWMLDGAAVHVSMVGFDNGTEPVKTLDGAVVAAINPDLTATVDLTTARTLPENAGLCFLGMMKAGPFDIDGATARAMLAAPTNPNGRANADVVKRRLGGQDVTGRPRDSWVIDFGVDMPEGEAALYEEPFEYVHTHVKPERETNNRDRLRMRWWLYGEARPGLRRALGGLQRCIVTPEVAKYRLFVWMDTAVIPDHKLHVIARSDDYCLGLLHSRMHELWSLKQGSTLEDRPSYASSRTFETFPFPWPPGKEPVNDPRVEAIAQAARELVAKRAAWLNPPGVSESELRRRTLTNLYNERPTWLDLAHRRLDAAVFDAYGWPLDLTDEQVLERLLGLNLERAKVGEAGPVPDVSSHDFLA